MEKSLHVDLIFFFLPIMILIPCIICAIFNVPVVLHPLTTNFRMLSTDSPAYSTDPPAQNAIPASRESIVIGDFKFRISRVVFDETAIGFIPVDMDECDQVMFVEFELLGGSKEYFKALQITVADDSGQKSNAFILTSGGMIQMLATVIMKSASSDYQPGEDNITWAYLVPRGVSELYLNFPTGEMIDLTQFMKSSRCVALKSCHGWESQIPNWRFRRILGFSREI